jgi:DNA-binding transcriptional MerR regulator
MVNRQNNYITAGQFARLAGTTKRTIHWYDQKGLLRPKEVNEEGYRLYNPWQLIDFKLISLLSNLGFSLEEIQKASKSTPSLQKLFQSKQAFFKQELLHLQKKVKDIDMFYKNMDSKGVLVDPEMVKTKPVEIYSIEKYGGYREIYGWCFDLKSCFERPKKSFVYVTIFLGEDFSPKGEKMRIGIVAQPGMKLKKGKEAAVKKETIPSYRALKYIHTGSPLLVSMLWQELRKYARQNSITFPDKKLPFTCLEYYHRSELNDFHDEEFMVSELHLPIQ